MDLARYLVLLTHNAIFSRYLPANCISDPAACNLFLVSLNALLNQSYPGVESDGLAACIWRIYDTDLDGQISFRWYLASLLNPSVIFSNSSGSSWWRSTRWKLAQPSKIWNSYTGWCIAANFDHLPQSNNIVPSQCNVSSECLTWTMTAALKRQSWTEWLKSCQSWERSPPKKYWH